MADWTDGPEYAPRARPEVFVAPQTKPLGDQSLSDEEPPAAAAAAAVTATLAPTSYAEPPTAVALEQVAPPQGPERNPREPFSVVSMSVGSAQPDPAQPVLTQAPVASPAPGSWAGIHAATPAPPAASGPEPRPLPGPATPAPPGTPHGWPAPAGPQGYPASPQGHPNTPPGSAPVPPRGAGQGVPVPEIVRAVTPGVLICLAVGGLVTALSLPLLWVGQMLALRIPYHRAVVNRTFVIAAAVAVTMGLVSALLATGGFDFAAWLNHALGWGQAACWIVLVVVIALEWSALRRGEQPDPQ